MQAHGILTPTGAIRAWWSLLMVLVAAALITGAGWAYTLHVQGQFRCQARYNTALQERSVILTKVAAEDRQQSQAAEENITRLITDAIAAAGDKAKGQAAAQRYLRTSKEIADKRAELERKRTAQPFPQTPEKACT